MDNPAAALRAISDDTRLAILSILLNHDLCTGAVARRLGVSEAAVSQHMKVLREAGLVTPVRRGYFTHYDVDRDAIRELATVLVDMSSAERQHCNPDFEGCNAKRRSMCPAEKGNCGCPHSGSGKGCFGCSRCTMCQHNGSEIMKAAVTYENGEVFQHFGRTSEFKVYDIQNGKVISSEVVSTMGRGHGELVGVLRSLGVSAVICGGMGDGARNGLLSSGIAVYTGNKGSADAVAEAFAAGRLDGNNGPTCDHHGEGDHACTCGRH